MRLSSQRAAGVRLPDVLSFVDAVGDARFDMPGAAAGDEDLRLVGRHIGEAHEEQIVFQHGVHLAGEAADVDLDGFEKSQPVGFTRQRIKGDYFRRAEKGRNGEKQERDTKASCLGEVMFHPVDRLDLRLKGKV